MKRSKTTCKSVQHTLATGRGLSPAQQRHLEYCPVCPTTQRHFQLLDTLVHRVTEDLVPTGFNDRLMARMQAEPFSESDTEIPICDKLLARFSHSCLLRNIAISLGIILGIGQLVQLVLGIFFVSMMAAM